MYSDFYTLPCLVEEASNGRVWKVCEEELLQVKGKHK